MFQFMYGQSRTAVVGMISVGMAIALSSFSVVRAEHAKPATNKTFSCSSGTACVEGNASGSATNGVYGSASGSGTHGVYGTSNWAGVTGYTSSTNGGSGVSGVSTETSGNAHGVYGKSSNGVGVYGTSTSAQNGDGVEGTTNSENGNGVYGHFGGGDYGGYGVMGESNDTTGAYGALGAQADNSLTWIFQGVNTETNGFCGIDPHGNLTCSGTIGGSAMQVQQPNNSGRHVLSYASQSASATIEDVGTARMYDGVANVQINPDFASVMDHRWYYVFLTPLGDTRGLYVSVKKPSEFQVRETEHGRDALAFDYRIVAHPLGASSDRLPTAPAMRRPRTMHPAQ
jgi:hypothetical protein